MSKWIYEDDPEGQKALKQLLAAQGNDPSDTSSFINATTNFFNPANETQHRLAPESPFSNTSESGNSTGGPPLAKVFSSSLDKVANAGNIPYAATQTGNQMGGILGFLSKLKGAGLDPTTLGLGLLSSLVGNNGPITPHSYASASPGAAQLVSPIQSLYNAINASNNFGTSLNNMLVNGVSTPSSYVPAPPKPVSIPGLSFQIGGGLGTDPALKDPSLLTKSLPGDFFSPIQQQGGGTNMSPGYATVPKRRSPQ